MADWQEFVPKSARVIVTDTSMGVLRTCDWLAAVMSSFNVAVRCMSPVGNSNKGGCLHMAVYCAIYSLDCCIFNN